MSCFAYALLSVGFDAVAEDGHRRGRELLAARAAHPCPECDVGVRGGHDHGLLPGGGPEPLRDRRQVVPHPFDAREDAGDHRREVAGADATGEVVAADAQRHEPDPGTAATSTRAGWAMRPA